MNITSVSRSIFLPMGANPTRVAPAGLYDFLLESDERILQEDGVSAPLQESAPTPVSPVTEFDITFESGDRPLQEDGFSAILDEASPEVAPSVAAFEIQTEDGGSLLTEGADHLLQEEFPDASSAACWADPHAATFVLPPGQVSRGPARPRVTRGYAADYAFQVWNRGSISAPANFGPDDVLTAALYRRRIPTPIGTPAVEWHSPAGCDPGYILARVRVGIDAGLSSLLAATGGPVGYRLVVRWSPAASPQKSVVIIRLPLAVVEDY